MEIKITDSIYPPEMHITDDEGFKQEIPIQDYGKQCDDVLGQVYGTFELIKIKRAMHLFEGNTITIKENK